LRHQHRRVHRRVHVVPTPDAFTARRATGFGGCVRPERLLNDAAAAASRREYGYWLVFAAAVCWALLGVFSQRLLDAGVSALEIAFWRAALAGCLFIAHAAVTRQLRLLHARDLVAFAAF